MADAGAPDAPIADMTGDDGSSPKRGAALPAMGDVTFGKTGLLGGPLDWVPLGIAIAPDGTLFVTGTTYDGTYPPKELVWRLAPSGMIDTTFGTGGEAQLGASPGPFGQSAAVMPDGSLEIVGATSMTGGAFALLMAPDGTAAPGFGIQGIWESTAIGQASAGVFGSDGSVLVLGDGGVAHVTASGSLDSAFVGAMALSGATSGARGSSGTSIVSDGTGLARYTATGALDPTFGSQGVVAQAFPASAPASPTIAAVAVDTAGRIVVAGSHTDGSSVDVDVARLTSAGTPDTAFAGGATASLAAAIPVGVAISADGRIVVWTVSGEAMAWLDDGTVDSSLGALPVVDLGVEGTVLGGMLDANDRLVVVGITTDTTPSTWFVRRYVL